MVKKAKRVAIYMRVSTGVADNEEPAARGAPEREGLPPIFSNGRERR